MGAVSVFSKNMIKIRKFLDLNQVQAAELIGIRLETLSAYELGRSEPCHEVLKRICEGYKVENMNSFMWNPCFLEKGINEPEINSIVVAYYKLSHDKRKIVDFILNGE